MDGEGVGMFCHKNPVRKSKPITATSTRKSLSDSSLVNEKTLYTYDYTTCKDCPPIQSARVGGEGDEGGLSFVRLLKRELSKKKIQENGTLTEEYKDNYFKLVDLNRTLTKNVNQIKTKIKQYKQILSKLNDKHDEEIQMYTNQIENITKNMVLEKSKLEEEQREVLGLRNAVRDTSRRIETFESEIQKTVEARKSAEAESTFRDCEIATASESHDTYKQRLLQVNKELEVIRENSKRFKLTRHHFEDKIKSLLNTNEKIKVNFGNLLLDNETLKLENKSLDKVLKAHENICLELLKIAADKLDAHNDGKVLNEITHIMKKLDENKEKFARQMKRIRMSKQQGKQLEEPNSMISEKSKEDSETIDPFYEVVGTSGNGHGDGFQISQYLDDSD